MWYFHRGLRATQIAYLRASEAQAQAGAAFAAKRARAAARLYEAGTASADQRARAPVGLQGQADVCAGPRSASEPCPVVLGVEARSDPATSGLARGARLGAHVGARRTAVATIVLVTWLLLSSEISAGRTVPADGGRSRPGRPLPDTRAFVARSQALANVDREPQSTGSDPEHVPIVPKGDLGCAGHVHALTHWAPPTPPPRWCRCPRARIWRLD